MTKTRCALGCSADSGSPLHRFPNIKNFPDQFKAWVFVMGGKLEGPEDHLQYRNKRICDIHFTHKHRNRNNRISALAVPSLYLPMWCNKFDKNLSASQLTIQATSNQIRKELKLINDNKKSENGNPMAIESNDNDESNNDMDSNPVMLMDHDDSYAVHPDIKPDTVKINTEKHVQSNKPEADGSVFSSMPLTPNVCRICLATDVKMYPIEDFQLRRIYQQLTGVELNPEDQLPKALCWECVGRLISAHKFRNKALRAHSLLTDIHLQTHANIQDFIISKIKCYSGLESTLTTKHFSNDDVHLIILEDQDATTQEKTNAFEEHENNNFSDVFTEVIVDDIDHMGPEEVILEVNDNEVSAKDYTELISDKDSTLSEVFIDNNINTIKGTTESESNENEFLEDSEVERTREVLLQKFKISKKFISNKVKQDISPADAIERLRIRKASHFSSDRLGRRPAGHAPAGAPLMCDQCGKIHTELKPFECESCGKCFKTLAERRSRVQYVHLRVPWPKGTRGTSQIWRPTET